MYLTLKEYEAITLMVLCRLRERVIRDSEFDFAGPLEGDETFVIVQNHLNKRMHILDLKDILTPECPCSGEARIFWNANGGYWGDIEYTITWKTAGGKWYDNTTTDKTTTVINDEVPVEPEKPTRAGYTFKKWTPDITSVTEDTTYTATWEANSYTITYDVNGGNALTPNTLTVHYDEAYTLKTPTRTGYTFAGWFYNGNQITDGVYKYTTNITVVAHWNINQYTLTWNPNGGKWSNNSTANKTTTLNYGTTAVAPTPNPTKEGYIFKGWSPLLSAVTGNKTYIAQWELDNITITWDPNGGEWS